MSLLEQHPGMAKDKSISKERLAETSVTTNCKGVPGNSGSAYYSFATSTPRVSAILAKGIDPHEERVLGSSYGSRAIPISGRFKAAIEKATSNKNCIKSYTPPVQNAGL